jgi:predicted nucleic acid-binding protein
LIALDTNVLAYAHREEFPEHGRALEWLRHVATGTPRGLFRSSPSGSSSGW